VKIDPKTHKIYDLKSYEFIDKKILKRLEVLPEYKDEKLKKR